MTHVKHVSNKILLQKKRKKGYDKKRHQKLVLNKLKVMGNCVFIYTHWAPSSKKKNKFNSIYMWPEFTYVCPCAHSTMNELKFN
jgi:hypothetical protein